MRRVRVTICIVFIISVILFAGYNIKAKMIEDSKPPVITCDQDEITISVKDDESALLKGIKAEDNRDGDITDSVRVSSMSHFINGKRTVIYAVFDKSNQVGTLERTVKYSDYTSPKIYLKKPFRFITTASSELKFDEMFLAEDCLDGDITSQVRTIMGDYSFGAQEGVYNVTLQVSNSAGDVCSVPIEMQIYYTDNEDEREKQYPVLSDYIVYTTVGKKVDTKKLLTGITRGNAEYLFEDDMTGVSADNIKITSDVKYDTPGVYTVEYSYKAEGVPKAVTKLYVVVEEK